MHSGNGSNEQDEVEAKRSFIERARREQIIAAAIGTLAELGYAKASFAKIAQRAEVSPSLISYHFQSKADLVKSVSEFIDQEISQAMEAATSGAASHLDALRLLIAGFIRYADANRQVMLSLWQLSVGVGHDYARLAPNLDPSVAVAQWQQLLEAGQAAGEFRGFDSRVVAVGIQGILESLPREIMINPESDVERMAAEVAAMVELAIISPTVPSSPDSKSLKET